MDYTQTLQPLLYALWYLIPLAILARVIRSPWFKGKAGEAIVNLSAKLFLDKTRYQLIKNVTLPTEEEPTLIDHIIASRYGVLLLETMRAKLVFHRRYSEDSEAETEGAGKLRFPSSGFLN